MIVLFFARARDLAGVDRVELSPAPKTVGGLRDEIGRRFANLTPFLAKCAIAVGNEFADDEHALVDSDEVALLPPVSGG